MINVKIPLIAASMFLLQVMGSTQEKEMDSLKLVLSRQKEDSNKVNTLLLISKTYAGSSPEDAIIYGQQARALAAKLHFKKGEALALKNIGIGYYMQAKYVETLYYWEQSMAIFQSLGDKAGMANSLSNIGSIYFNQSDDARALEYYLQSLKLAEETGDKLRMATALQNVGNVYANKSATYSKALEYLLKALPLSEELKDQNAMVTITTNVGEVYVKKGKIDSALYYYKKSLKASENSETVSTTFILNNIGDAYAKRGDFGLAVSYQKKAVDLARRLNAKLYMAKSLLGLADTYFKMGETKTALDTYKEAQALAEEVHGTYELKDIYAGLASSYARLGDYSQAFSYHQRYASFKDTLYNLQTDKKLASLQFDFDLYKKQGEINLLTKDKELQELELKRQRAEKIVLIVGLALVFVIAFIIYRNYRAKVRINKILDKQKAQIESLLLNILPWEVAQELQATGHATPRHYENVSVLFTDFKGFTALADKMPPGQLVEELNTCFMAFDNIIEKYELEKIKTIGDSYMCAGGIPGADEQHQYKIVKAGLEMQQFIYNYNDTRKSKGLEIWDVRIGIHIGPVVAGVVGKKKYAYDIWGSTVNIASRMESNGQPGQVNISAAAYEQVKDRFECSYRGKIYAKNVGDIDMYFVERELPQQPPFKEIGKPSPQDEIVARLN